MTKSLDKLENLRVELSEELEHKIHSMKSQDDKLAVNQIRAKLTEVIDDIQIAHNLEADAEKERMLSDIRQHEHENQIHYNEYYNLLQVVVPALQTVVDNLDRANQLASWLQSDRSSITQLQGHYNKEYNESIEVNPHSARGVPDHDQITRVLEWLQSDLDSYDKLKETVVASKAKAKQVVAEGNLAGGSKVMQSVIKNKAEVEAAGKV